MQAKVDFCSVQLQQQQQQQHRQQRIAVYGKEFSQPRFIGMLF